jgi:hypothetical protein
MSPNRIQIFRHHWRVGRYYGIPVCCRCHFCFDQALERVASVVRWRQIARWETKLINDRAWVPCGVVHRGYSPLPLWKRVYRIITFNLILVLPGRRARCIRRRASAPGPVWTGLPAAEKARISQLGGNGQLWWADRLERVRTRTDAKGSARAPGSFGRRATITFRISPAQEPAIGSATKR